MQTLNQPKKELFGQLPSGEQAHLFTLTNSRGLRARVSDLGATLLSMELADVVLGFDTPGEYLAPTNSYHGATVGRFGNRICDGVFQLNGKTYELAKNNTPGGVPCHLHGGNVGFNLVLWDIVAESPDSITFAYTSVDGEEGYPGTLKTLVTYTLTEDNELVWQVEATTDAPTILNIVHHSYWNLSGDTANSILEHELTVHADHFLPTTPGLIPTGEIQPVEGTPLDFRKPHLIGERINTDFEPLNFAAGYDHCWVLSGEGDLRSAAKLHDPASGRSLEVLTDQPAIHVYTGNFLDDVTPGKKGMLMKHRSACCLETENFPDAPNQSIAPSCVLNPGETYRHTLIHRFTAD
jgi:aldose 1-epimerase